MWGVTPNIEKTIIQYKELGFKEETEIIFDDLRNIKIIFIKNEDYRIELIESLSEKSTFYNLLKKYKNTFYHVCYETTELETTLKELRNKGYMPITQADIAPAIDNQRVIFLMNPQMGIIELVEIKEKNERTGIPI